MQKRTYPDVDGGDFSGVGTGFVCMAGIITGKVKSKTQLFYGRSLLTVTGYVERLLNIMNVSNVIRVLKLVLVIRVEYRAALTFGRETIMFF